MQMQKLLTFFFSKNISVYAIFNYQTFNDTLSNNIFSFESLGPDDIRIKKGTVCLIWFNTIYIVRLSLLTMTNPNQLCDVLLFLCPKMADETNLSTKLPVADRTREV